MAFSCHYFNGHHVSSQTLVLEKEREDICTLGKETVHGETVHCIGSATATRLNATATRLNDTTILLRTNEGPNASYIMNYGEKQGESAFSYSGACPTSSGVLGNMHNGAEHSQMMSVLLPVIIVAAIIAAIIIGYVMYKKRKPKKNGGKENAKTVKNVTEMDGDSNQSLIDLEKNEAPCL